MSEKQSTTTTTKKQADGEAKGQTSSDLSAEVKDALDKGFIGTRPDDAKEGAK